ncbi:MAG: branched-chain amino acid ABC transporter permease [Chloroflexi bacterium]|nr:branched-chain amino acid ABC transporter permease [Chloroflexota bacterium]
MSIDLLATGIALLTFFGISALMALSLNLEYGVAGIPNFGKALFVSIGAYTAGVTYTRLLPLLAGQEVIDPCGRTLADALQLRSDIMFTDPTAGWLNFAITLLIAGLIGGAVGYGLSYITLRLKEEWFLALVLLVSGEIIRIVVRGYDPIICAHNGLSGIAQPFVAVGDTQTASILFAALTVGFALIAFVYAERLIRSPYGRLLRAIRENEHVSQSLGKQVARIRAQVMFIGSFMAAVAGVLFALNIGFVNTNDYVVTLTLDVWVMVVLGGAGNMRGALLGAAVITILDRVTAIVAIQLNMAGSQWEFNYFRFILFGLLLLLMLRFRPQGILPERRDTTSVPLVFAEETADRGAGAEQPSGD